VWFARFIIVKGGIREDETICLSWGCRLGYRNYG